MKSSSLKKEKKMKSLIDRITPLWGKVSYQEIADKVGSTAESVRKCGRGFGLPPYKLNAQNRALTVEQEIERDVKVGSLDKRLKTTDSKYQQVLKLNQTLQEQIDAIKVVGDANSFTISAKSSGTIQATAFIVASDWHWAETVEGKNINGLNEFNIKIAKERSEKFFVNSVKLLNIFKAHSKIDTLVLALLGDFMNGELREESMQNNGELTMNELLGVYEALLSGIKYLIDNTDVNLIIPCHSGNHGRITKKIHVATEAGNSLEYIMYHMLARQFVDNNRVKFIIPTSYHSYIDIDGFTVRLSHGHAIRYAGGVGGIFIPVKKAIAQWNKARHADLDVIGHYHQVRDGGDFICNGSLVGYNEFANFIKADFEKPKQVFFLDDHKRKEKTITTPIFLE